MTTRSPFLRRRLPAVLAVVALPLTALVGCGQAEQAARSSIETELTRAGEHLLDSEATSVVMSFDDPYGTAERAATSGEDPVSAELADVLLGGSIAITVDPVSGTLRELQAADPATPPSEALRLTNLAISVDADGGPLAQVRLVEGVLYASVDLDRITGIAETAGEPGGGMVDELAASLPPDLQPAVTDLQDGRWLRLPIEPYAGTLDELAAPGTDTPSPAPTQLANDLLAAVKPFVEVTDAGGDGAERVLDVKVQVRKALDALLASVTSSGAVPGLEELPTDALEGLGEGTADGQVTLQDSHLTRISLDLASVARLSPDAAEAPDLTGSTLVVTIDDTAEGVAAPDDVSPVDLAELFASFTGLGEA